MLTKDQEKYLETIPENKKIIIQDFNPTTKIVSDQVITRIKAEGIKSKVWNIGSTELGIAGQNDIDINILSSPEKYKEELPILEKLFGPPRQKEKLPMKWEFKEGGFDVEVYLTNATTETFKEHLEVFIALKHNPVLGQYEELKKSSNGGSFREYMKRKYEFFNGILENSKGKSGAVGELEDFRK